MRATWHLNGTWRLWGDAPGSGERVQVFAPDYNDQDWLPISVPGDVHTALVQAGRLPEPYYHTNVEAIRWVEEQEWWYRTTFIIPPPSHEPHRDVLVFDGLDTFATVYLNGVPLGDHRNMFRPAEFDITDRVHYGQPNVLAVRFDPVHPHLAGKTIPDQWGKYNPERVFVRKTQAHFSWDWAPQLLNVGIWRGVRVERYSWAHLYFPYVRVLDRRNTTAIVAVECEVRTATPDRELRVHLSLTHQAQRLDAEAPVVNGVAHLVLTVPDVALWWPVGYGPQPLYDVTVTLLAGDQTLDTFHDQVGLRTVRLDRSPDPEEVGNEHFTFVINGVPVFAKGANWIPADLMNGRVTPERYERLLQLLVEANGNMLRVWGGGQYEKDAFYRFADKLGILIWQDFMFACARYPDDPEFLAEVRAEAEYQVRRLRNRASVVIWVGNNENDWIEDLVYWQEPGHPFPGQVIYHRLLPEVIAHLDPSRPYWPSSPYGGNDHNGEQAGDRHNWYVWHGGVLPRRFGEPPQRDWSPRGVSYRHYAEDTGRFISEFGIHAAPVPETLRRNIPSKALFLNSPALLFRIKDEPKDKGLMLMRAHTGLPSTLEEYIDFSMICQAEGLKYGIEHYRRRKFHCSGTLFWQWNDCWPGLSWSVVDYYGFPKAGYFYVRRAYAAVLASVKEEPDGGVTLWITNDTLAAVDDALLWTHGTFEGERLHEGRVEVHIPPNSSVPVIHLSAAQLSGPDRRREYLWLRSERGTIPENRYFFAEIKDLIRPQPRLEITWEQEDTVLVAHVRTDVYAYFVHFLSSDEDVCYSDNWFDIPPGETRTVRIWHRTGQPVNPETLQVRWR